MVLEDKQRESVTDNPASVDGSCVTSYGHPFQKHAPSSPMRYTRACSSRLQNPGSHRTRGELAARGDPEGMQQVLLGCGHPAGVLSWTLFAWVGST